MIGIHFSYITKILADTLVTKMPSELHSTEQIFIQIYFIFIYFTTYKKNTWKERKENKYTSVQEYRLKRKKNRSKEAK